MPGLLPKHCRWCGRFLKQGTQPTMGQDARGNILGQYLCPECEPQWLDLSARNIARLAR